MEMNEILAAWLFVAAGVIAAATVILVGGGLAITRKDRGGGARPGRSRPEAGGHGRRRRGDGWPRRHFREELVVQFLDGRITLEDLKDFYNGRV